MNSAEIYRILSRDPVTSRYFVGVFPSDRIPEVKDTPAAMVINNEEHFKSGAHWLAVYINENETCEFFDSFALPPAAYGENISAFVNRYPVVKWNKIPFQSLTSNVCGPYCIYYLFKRCKRWCMKSIIKSLTGKRNDFRVFQFVKKRYGVKMIFKK